MKKKLKDIAHNFNTLEEAVTSIFLGLGNFIYLEYASKAPFIPRHWTSTLSSLAIIANTFLNSAINFILDVSNNKWIFTDMTLGTFLQPLKDSKEHWIFCNTIFLITINRGGDCLL